MDKKLKSESESFEAYNGYHDMSFLVKDNKFTKALFYLKVTFVKKDYLSVFYPIVGPQLDKKVSHLHYLNVKRQNNFNMNETTKI